MDKKIELIGEIAFKNGQLRMQTKIAKWVSDNGTIKNGDIVINGAKFVEFLKEEPEETRAKS